MFCPKCGSKLKDTVYVSEVNLETTKNLEETGATTEELVEKSSNEDVYGLCPHCGYAIPNHLGEDDLKKLNQVAHAKYHSARNKWNTGMCGIVAGGILFAIAAIFFVLCFKVAENYRFSTEGEPFIVFVALASISVCLFVFGAIYVATSNANKKTYSTLIKDISNKTFIQ
jgi:hypothetical protein